MRAIIVIIKLAFVAMDSDKKLLKTLGSNLRKIREGKSISQDEVAFRAGLARSYYGGIERGQRNVSSINLYKLAEALDVKVGDFFPK